MGLVIRALTIRETCQEILKGYYFVILLIIINFLDIPPKEIIISVNHGQSRN